MHADQLEITPSTVRALIAEQFPQWAGLEVRRVSTEGTVNAIFRIGDALAARFPLRPGDPATITAEFEAARELLAGTSVPVPEPVALGEPGPGFAHSWSVQTWLPGTTGTDADPGDSSAFAHDLAAFIRELRAIDTRGRTFSGKGRGGDLSQHDAWVHECLEKSGDLVDVLYWGRQWEGFRELPRTAPDVMSHTDLIPGNVLVADGRLAGVLDVGGFGPADPALDLVSAWHLLGDRTRPVLRAGLEVDDLTWERGRAWAFEQAIGLVWYYERSNPTMSRLGSRTLARLARVNV